MLEGDAARKAQRLCLKGGEAADTAPHTQTGRKMEGNSVVCLDLGFAVYLLAPVRAGALQLLLLFCVPRASPFIPTMKQQKTQPQEGKELAGKGKAAAGTSAPA